MVLGFDNPFAPSTGSFPLPVVPPDTDPDEGDQVTVCFSVDWLPFVLGALQQLTLQATWKGDDATVLLAQSRAQLLLANIADASGGCFGSVCFPDVFYDSDCDCVKQIPPGGGSPIEKPEADPRHNTAFQFPPIDADDPQCQAAANIVRFISDLIDEVVAALDHTSEAAGLLPFLLPIFVELGPYGIFIDLMLELASILIGAGATTISDAFTNTVYDQLTCIFYCNIESDGTVTAADLVTIEAEIASIIGGTVQAVLEAMFLIQGEVGLTNAGAVGDAPADCSGCPCTWCFDFEDASDLNTWSNFAGGGGTYNSGTGRWEGTAIGSGTYGVIYGVDIQKTFAPVSIEDISVRFGTSYNDGGRPTVILYLSGSQVGRIDSTDATGSIATNQTDDYPFGGITCDQIRVFMAGGITPVTVDQIVVRGDGTNPFGTDNCI